MRLERLAARLMSPAVQVPEPARTTEVEERLSRKQIEQLFIDHVPGFKDFLFRGMPGQRSLKFIVSVYREGWQAFRSTELHKHLMWLMRLVVHHAYDGGAGAAAHLAEVAEAFRDCQAVQARAVERVGLRLSGVSSDFGGLATRLVGEYKSLAIQMLALERVASGLANDTDEAPTHYENRLTADIGPCIGANADDIRRARLDGHAAQRFPRLSEPDVAACACRCCELFDVTALLQAFVAEVNSFGPASGQESLPALFLSWASEHMVEKHAVFDDATCSRVDIDVPFALCVFEALFFGGPCATATERHRGLLISEIFRGRPDAALLEAVAAPRGQRKKRKSHETATIDRAATKRRRQQKPHQAPQPPSTVRAS